MKKHLRKPRDVVSDDPALLADWGNIPPQVQRRMLESTITVSSLGELKKLAEEWK